MKNLSGWLCLLAWFFTLAESAATIPLSGGGSDAGIAMTRTQFVAALQAKAGFSNLMTVSGGGSEAMTAGYIALQGGDDLLQLTTAQEVVDLLQGDAAASALVTTTLSGEGEAVLTPSGLLAMTGGGKETSYIWDSQDRLVGVTMADGKEYNYEYDYRTRRIGIGEGGAIESPKQTAVLFAGGLSLAEYESEGATAPTTIATPQTSTVHYVRGPDMGGGVGGMLYSVRGGEFRYSLSNGRGDIVAQSNQSAQLTWTASYEAFGNRTTETGTNPDRQRANTKDEDPTGLLNEGFRYRDLETGVWLSRDPAGFVDGPNLYAYVKQNPWTGFDPEGLADEKPGEGSPIIVKSVTYADPFTKAMVDRVRSVDSRLDGMVSDLENSPYPHQITANITQEKHDKGSPRGQTYVNDPKKDGESMQAYEDRINGKGTGSRICSNGGDQRQGS